uniref:CSON003191 protein n=1 Tax=Culicoides sonorensis TaxID=179676 RepID=A0A336MRX8_CULSO
MDHQGLYKSRLEVGNARNKAVRNHQERVKKQRGQAFLQNRNLDKETSVSPIIPEKFDRDVRSVEKKAGTIKSKTKTNERILKIREIRKRNESKSTDNRSPFISAVPVNRIVPKKRDILEKKMEKFHNRQQKVNKNREIASTKKRKSLGKSQLIVKTKANNVRVLVSKPMMARSNLVVKKEIQTPISSKTEPQPGTSKLCQPENLEERRLKTSEKLSNKFAAPSLTLAPQTNKNELTSFNLCQSFITSTTSKRVSSVKIVPDKELTNDTFLDGISPISDATPFKFEARRSSKYSKHNPDSLLLKGLPEPHITDDRVMEDNDEVFVFGAKGMTKTTNKSREQSINDELNVTFTQNEDEEEKISAEGNDNDNENIETTVHSNAKVSIDIERNTIAKTHYETLDSEIQRLTERNSKWQTIKDDNELDENIVGLINSAIGQSELLMRKKFPKFRELINLYEEKKNERQVFADDLEGWWTTVTMEIESIDKRFAQLEKCQANEWNMPEETECPVARPKRGRKKVERKKGTVSESLKAYIRNIKQQAQKKNDHLPEYEPSENVQLMMVKRRAETPRKSIAKRRSLNCSGCCTTPSSNRKSKVVKSISKLTISEQPNSESKSDRKSARKRNYVQIHENAKTEVEEVISPNVLKPKNKRNTKSVLFAAKDFEIPDNDNKTPHLDRKNNMLMDLNNENTPVMDNHVPMDMSNVTLSRGRQIRTRTPKPKVLMDMSEQHSPMSNFSESNKKKSSRLFKNL